jgi:hypothetical protein
MTQLNSMVELLARQASDHGDREAFRFLPERNAAETTLTFGRPSPASARSCCSSPVSISSSRSSAAWRPASSAFP